MLDVAKAFKLDWQTVKALTRKYRVGQIKRVGMPRPKAIGIGEIPIRRGHS